MRISVECSHMGLKSGAVLVLDYLPNIVTVTYNLDISIYNLKT